MQKTGNLTRPSVFQRRAARKVSFLKYLGAHLFLRAPPRIDIANHFMH